MFLALLPLVLLLFSDPAVAAPSPARNFTAASHDGLVDAIARAGSGDRITLAPGNYGNIDIRGKSWATDVTLISADARSPARIEVLTVVGVSHLCVKSLEIGRPLKPGEPDYAVFGNFREVNNVTFDGVFFHGSLDGNPSNDGNGLRIADSSRIRVNASRFEQLGRGLQISTTTDVSVTGNMFRYLRTDGLNFANVQRVLIDRNQIRDFSPDAGDHPDGIQFFTQGTTRSSTDIVITNNEIFQGRGAGIQGIFLTDQIGTLPYLNVRIENNLAYVYDGYNGITVMSGRGIDIIGNSVLSDPNDNQKFWIRLEDIQTVTLRNNIADSFVNVRNKGIIRTNTVFLDEKKGYERQIAGLSARANATVAGLVVAGIGYQPVR